MQFPQLTSRCCCERKGENKVLNSHEPPGGTCSTKILEHTKRRWVETSNCQSERQQDRKRIKIVSVAAQAHICHSSTTVHAAVLPADSSQGPRLNGLWANPWQQHGSWQGARWRLDKGSEREAIRILKRQNLQQSFSPKATFFESALFNYRVQGCKHWRKAMYRLLGVAIGATATTWPTEVTPHASKVTVRTGTIQSRCANSKNLGIITVNAFVERGTVFADRVQHCDVFAQSRMLNDS